MCVVSISTASSARRKRTFGSCSIDLIALKNIADYIIKIYQSILVE